MTNKIEATFTLERTTKNTYRFKEDLEAGKPPIMDTIYVKQYAVLNAKRIKVTVEVLE